MWPAYDDKLLVLPPSLQQAVALGLPELEVVFFLFKKTIKSVLFMELL